MTSVLVKRQLAIASLDTGATALEQIGAFAGDLFEQGAGVGLQGLNGMGGLTQRSEQAVTEGQMALTGFGVWGAGGEAFEVERGDEGGAHGVLDGRRLMEALHTRVHAC